MAARSQPVYDYYDDNDRDAVAAPRGPNSPPLDLNRLARAARHAKTTRFVVRRQSPDIDYQSDAPRRETRPILPPQPPPPGLFGGDRDDGWR
jgi:hypothetical protein